MSVAEIRTFLDAHGLRASRDLGQNFLIDSDQADRLVRLAKVSGEDAVIEIGTGLGILTRALAKRARAVVTVEIDAGLVRAHRADATFAEHVELLHADARKLDLREVAQKLCSPVKLVANLPYSASSPLLRRLLDLCDLLVDWSVMLQKEVADRLLAKPGTRDYGSLSVLVQLLTDVELCAELRPECFFPAPKIVSSFLYMRPRQSVSLDDDGLRRVERVVRAAFGKRRKTLVNCLKSLEGQGLGEGAVPRALEELGLDPRVRAEMLSPGQFYDLAQRLAPSPEGPV